MTFQKTIKIDRAWRNLRIFFSLEAGFERGPELRKVGEQEEERARYGLDLDSGDRHYRAWVGFPEEYDLIAALQVSLLLAAGLGERHKLADVGCGSLRAGRMLIPYLRPGNYHGIEPEQWLVEEGIAGELGRGVLEVKRPRFRFVSDFSLDGFGTPFDYVVAQSVFSHTYPDLLQLGLGNIRAALAPTGKLFATWVEGRSEKQGSGWIHKGVRQYTWEEFEGFVRDSGLVARRLNWPHPRQSWFVAARPEAEAEIEALSLTLQNPREGWGARRSRAQEQKRRRDALERRAQDNSSR